MAQRLFLVSLVALAWAGARAGPAPRNPAFEAWRDAAAAGEPVAGGLRPAPADTSYLPESERLYAARLRARAAASGRVRLMAAEPIPARWDAREHGYVSPVKNQGTYGTCWAFSTMAALESACLVATAGAVTNDFSENHLATHEENGAWGFACAFADGGNNDLAAALLTAWRDPLREEEDPYANSASTVDAPPCCHVQDIVWIAERTVSHANTADEIAAANEPLQRALMQYGALSIGYSHAWNHYRSDTGAHYLNEDEYVSTGSDGGHAVTLIGWDDTYPTNNFKAGRQPPGPGAFLAKNSWGSTSGTNGCFWISYYDDDLCFTRSAAYPAPEATNNYGCVYQYDKCGFVGSYDVLEAGETRGEALTNWCANVFVSAATGVVSAVGFYALAPGTEYEIRVYNALAGTTPDTGTLVTSQTGETATAGYVTVKLAEEVPVRMACERFAVVMRLASPGTDYPIPVCQAESGYVTTEAHAGESFYSRDGQNWTDFQHFDATANVCIKAYTRFGSDGPEAIELMAAADPEEGSTLALHAGESVSCAVTPRADYADASFTWHLGNTVLGTGTNLTFTATSAHHGNHVLRCRATYGAAYADEVSWTLQVCDDIRVADYAALVAAVADAVAGDCVWVAPGVYTNALTGPSVPITIRSQDGPAVTILERGAGSCCYNGYYCPDTLLAGFTLRNGDCQYGGGAYYATVSNCIIRDCVGNYGGGAYGSVLTHCTLCNNTAYMGGGACDSALTLCVVSNCTAVFGGGVADWQYDTDVVNGLLVSNRAVSVSSNWGSYGGQGGGAYEIYLYNCTLAGNTAAASGGGAYLHYYGGACNTLVAENVCEAGSANGHDVYGNQYWAMVCSLSDRDARFADAAHGDWRPAADSPALDAGTNDCVRTACDLDGSNRVFGARVDIGCYEYGHVAAGWTAPEVPAGALAAEEAAAVETALAADGFAPEVCSNVTTLVQYNALTAWSEKNRLASAALAASDTALVSSALDAAGLLALEEEDVQLAEIASDGAGAWTLALALDAYDPARVNAELLKAAVGVTGAPTPDGAFTADDLQLAVAPGDEAILVTVTPPAAAKTYFLRAKVR